MRGRGFVAVVVLAAAGAMLLLLSAQGGITVQSALQDVRVERGVSEQAIDGDNAGVKQPPAAADSAASPKPETEPALLDHGTHSSRVAVINPRRRGPAVDRVRNVTCPPYRFRGSKSADARHTHEAMVKYTRYVHQYCNATGLLQMHIDADTYFRFMDTVADIVRLRPGQLVFDWGSGCGTMLNYYNMRFGTEGVGIDVTEAAVAHARANGRDGQLFCFMDGSDLRSFPSAAFDAVVSWATLYHVRRTLVQCDIVHELVRMLKPGGVAFVGHLRTEKTQEYWKKGRCRPPNATIVRRSDARTFHMPAFRRNNFFSLIVTKQNTTTSATAPAAASPYA